MERHSSIKKRFRLLNFNIHENTSIAFNIGPEIKTLNDLHSYFKSKSGMKDRNFSFFIGNDYILPDEEINIILEEPIINVKLVETKAFSTMSITPSKSDCNFCSFLDQMMAFKKSFGVNNQSCCEKEEIIFDTPMKKIKLEKESEIQINDLPENDFENTETPIFLEKQILLKNDLKENSLEKYEKSEPETKINPLNQIFIKASNKEPTKKPINKRVRVETSSEEESESESSEDEPPKKVLNIKVPLKNKVALPNKIPEKDPIQVIKKEKIIENIKLNEKSIQKSFEHKVENQNKGKNIMEENPNSIQNKTTELIFSPVSFELMKHYKEDFSVSFLRSGDMIQFKLVISLNDDVPQISQYIKDYIRSVEDHEIIGQTKINFLSYTHPSGATEVALNDMISIQILEAKLDSQRFNYLSKNKNCPIDSKSIPELFPDGLNLIPPIKKASENLNKIEIVQKMKEVKSSMDKDNGKLKNINTDNFEENSPDGFLGKQVNYYFSDKNYFRDEFILGHVKKHHERYLSTKLLLNFPRIKNITEDVDRLTRALLKYQEINRNSNFEFDADKVMIRKRIN